MRQPTYFYLVAFLLLVLLLIGIFLLAFEPIFL